MLKLKYLFENYDLAKETLTHWRHDEATLDEMLTHFRISSNAIYPFYRDGKVYMLRLSPADEKLEQNFYGELEFLEYLHSQGYPAMEILYTDNGERSLTLDTRWGKYYAAVFKRVRGTQIKDLPMTRDMMLESGKALGRLHVLSSGFEPSAKRWSYEQVLEWIGGVLEENNACADAAIELASLKAELAALPRSADTYGLVHYDFESDNVFYDPETNTCSVIDFDDAMYHWYALDIEQTLDELAEVYEGDELAAARDLFIEGYKAQHCYTDEMDRSRPLMKRFMILYSYARLIRSVAETFPDEPDWLTGLRARLAGYIAEKEESFRR